ncbi:hypothetical protein HDU82_008994 [Entophlyctis luteolus]|nr:hypothetical protein HDU82_008994 [Entophlyctis luteolus]
MDSRHLDSGADEDSARALAHVCARLGFDIHAHSLEWLFAACPDAGPFLHWLQGAFARDAPGYSVLSEDEILAFKELLENNLVPDFASSEYLPDGAFDGDSDGSIDDEIDYLEEELRALEAHNNNLDQHKRALLYLFNIFAIIESTKSVRPPMKSKLNFHLMDQSFKDMLTVTDCVQSIFEPNTPGKSKFCLHQCREELSAFLALDESLSESLLQYCDEVFDGKRPDDESKTRNLTQFSYVSPSDRDEIVAEMQRLVELHTITEHQYLEALLGNAFASAKLLAISELNEKTEVDLGGSLVSAIQTNQVLQKNIKGIVKEELPALWIQLAEQSVKTPILKADYECKKNRYHDKLKSLQKSLKEWFRNPDFASDKSVSSFVDGRDQVIGKVMSLLGMREDNDGKEDGTVVLFSVDTVIEAARKFRADIETATTELKKAIQYRNEIGDYLWEWYDLQFDVREKANDLQPLLRIATRDAESTKSQAPATNNTIRHYFAATPIPAAALSSVQPSTAPASKKARIVAEPLFASSSSASTSVSATHVADVAGDGPVNASLIASSEPKYGIPTFDSVELIFFSSTL